MKLVIAILAVMFLMTACTKETITVADKIVVVEDGGEEAETKLVEIMIRGNTFNPDTIIVTQGDTLRLQFMNSKPFIFSFPEYGIAERVSNNQLEFIADQKGVFEFTCLDCEDAVVGVLKVI